MGKKKLIVSAINIRMGGAFTIAYDCLKTLDEYYSERYEIIALVHRKELYSSFNKIKFIEFPKSINSYLIRIFYEYIYFYFFSKKLKVDTWLSLHDISPNVISKKKIVYCHNPAPFFKMSFSNFLIEPKFFLFNFFYSYFYEFNIHKNDYVIVQQSWLKKEFIKKFKLQNIIVSKPTINHLNDDFKNTNHKSKKYTFLYPSYPRFFKNHEVIVKAVKEIESLSDYNFEIIFTFLGNENMYAKKIKKISEFTKKIKFIGFLNKNNLFNYYQKTDFLIFSSLLETWGLPISEFQQTNKLMILANLPYAFEASEGSNNLLFFNPSNHIDLSKIILKIIKNKKSININQYNIKNKIVQNNWINLFNDIL